MPLKIAVLFLALSPLFGQQIWSRLTNPQVTVTLKHPPGLGLQVDRVAIKPVRGKCVDDYAGALVEDFVNNGMQVIDRQRINEVLDELDLGASGYIDSATATKIGGLLGPSALMFVTVTRCASDRNRTYKTTKTKDGSYTTYYSKTDGFFKGSVQVVDLSTGRVFTAKTVEGRETLQNQSTNGYPEYPAAFDAIDRAMAQARAQVFRMFFSWTEQRQLVFFNNKKHNLKQAHQLLKIGDIEGALDLSLANLAACERDPKAKPVQKSRANYNVGILHFILGDHDRALGYLETAYAHKPGAIAKEAIQECRRAKQLRQEMTRVEARTAAVAQTASQGGGGAARARPNAQKTAAENNLDQIEQKLAKLKSMYDKGLITKEDYEKKKAEILESM